MTREETTSDDVYKAIANSHQFSSSLKAKLATIQYLREQVSTEEDTSMEKELLELTSAFNSQFKSIEASMSKIIQGDSSFSLPQSAIDQYKLPQCSKDRIKAIPSYWMTVIRNSGYYSLTEDDEKLLEKLKDVAIDIHQDNLSYTLRFHFDKNDVFANDILEKAYYLDKKSKDCYETKASEILWKGEDRKEDYRKSDFFKMFMSHGADDAYIEEENNEGDQLKNDLIPFSLEFFLNLMSNDK